MDKTNQGSLTIIIPHYNTPDSLCGMLKSIGRHDHVQIIVVDDHSSIDLEKLEECQKKYCYVTFLQTDGQRQGAGAARNIGLKHAKGKWLMFADADDEYLPDWYETISEYLTSDYDLVYFKPVSRKADQSPSNRHLRFAAMVDNYLARGYGGEERLRYRFVVPWSKLIRTNIVQNNNITFDEVLYSNDVMFSTMVGFHASKITASSSEIYCVIEHEGSLTYRNSGKVYISRMHVICRQQEYLNQHLTKKALVAAGRTSTVGSLMDAVRKGYDYKTCLELYRVLREYHIPWVAVNWRKHLKNRKKS